MGLEGRRASDSLVGKDLNGIESCHRLAILPRRFTRAGVDSQCERTGEALVQALRDDVQPLTPLKAHFDVEIDLKLLNNQHNS